ncbi:MAG: hypothetical protein PVF09_05445 [Desulfobacterales bacterium]|jgi:hypothetical protein
MLCPKEMEAARRARVPGPEKAAADVTRKTHRPERKTRAAGGPAAEAARVAERAAGKAPVKAGESGLNTNEPFFEFRSRPDCPRP